MKKYFLNVLLVFTFVHSSLFMVHSLYAQDSKKLTELSQRIIEAKSDDEMYEAFEETADLYLREDKFNEFVDFLKSLSKQKTATEPAVNYYTALTRYYQLKYLEETQNWDDYFNKGNAYRDEITACLQKAISAVKPSDILGVYARLVLWKFHKDQNDNFTENSLSDLMLSVPAFAQASDNIRPIKDVANELMAYEEKGKAKELYKLYVDKIVVAKISDEEMANLAQGFYKEGNLDLAEAIYDVYIKRAQESGNKEKLVANLIEITKAFAYRDEGPSDMGYAEKAFQKIEETGGKEAFEQELMYLRAFNLEKAKEFKFAADAYTDFLKRFPKSGHAEKALYKLGIIHTYILKDEAGGRNYFTDLSGRQGITPHVISSLYQLGLLSQWQGDSLKAGEYYNKLLEKAGSQFPETQNSAQERLKEISENRPLEYALKTFLDIVFKAEFAQFDMSKVDLRSHPYTAQDGQEVKVSSTSFTGESGCMQVELQYLWSGDLGQTKPNPAESSFATQYLESSSKEINLVVTSPNGIIDYSIDLLDVD